ncbi:MAG: phosphatidylglycerophosphate synthase [Arenicella sp.]|jgi:phosphatidylglycerophosphate synthase
MGIVVCIVMLLGLSVLQPSPWNSVKRVQHASKLVLFSSGSLLAFGLWNVIYGYSSINGFWMWASMISGSAMVLASYYVFSERHAEQNSEANTSGLRKVVVALLAISFLLYSTTLIQLNLGYSILR